MYSIVFHPCWGEYRVYNSDDTYLDEHPGMYELIIESDDAEGIVRLCKRLNRMVREIEAAAADIF